ncbi:MAG: hypothetical protein R3C68_16610 [Myxococcota bacterium]
MNNANLETNTFYKAGLPAAQEAIRRDYEAAPGTETDKWAVARHIAVKSLETYMAYHQSDGGARITTILNRLRDGVASKVDYQNIKAMAAVPSSAIKSIEKGEMPEASTASLETRHEMVRAFHTLLKEQGFMRTAAETMKDRLNPSPNVAETKYQQAIKAETGKKYEVVLEKETQTQAFGGGYDWVKSGGIYPVEGAGKDAQDRAKKLVQTIVNQHKRSHAVVSMAPGGFMPSSIRLGIREVGQESVEWVGKETFHY